MANDRLFSFTKNDAYFLKKILPSCKITAYQIPQFQSVMESLDNPIKPDRCVSVTSEQQIKYDLPVETLDSIPNSQNTQTRSESFFKSPGLTKSIESMVQPVVIEDPVVELQEPAPIEEPKQPVDIESAGMFDTIDNRTR